MSATAKDLAQEKDVVFAGVSGGQGRTLYSVTHDIFGDPFWAVYRKGLEHAAARFDCTVHHLAPAKYAPDEMIRYVEKAVSAAPDGIIATVPDASVVDGPLRRACSAGIPVIAVNMADRRHPDERIPYMMYVGPDDIEGGRVAARRLLHDSPRADGMVVCVDHYQIENESHVARRIGLVEATNEAGREIQLVRVFGEDHDRSVNVLREFFRHNDVAIVCTLGPPGAVAVIDALAAEDLSERVLHGSFDLALRQVEAVAEGRLLFTVDSQQYLQAYLGIGLLHLYLEHGFCLAADVRTGPRLIDRAHVEEVKLGVLSGVR